MKFHQSEKVFPKTVIVLFQLHLNCPRFSFIFTKIHFEREAHRPKSPVQTNLRSYIATLEKISTGNQQKDFTIKINVKMEWHAVRRSSSGSGKVVCVYMLF